jgi:pimeloyl-ACP methyl ester carboxylesterase
MSTTPVVLIHGSYHQPAHYDELVSRLADDAGGVTVPDVGMLPLTQSIPLVQDIVDQVASPPVVVGHSFGGAVAGALHGVRHIVFLSAWVLDVDETAGALLAKVGATNPQPAPNSRRLFASPLTDRPRGSILSRRRACSTLTARPMRPRVPSSCCDPTRRSTSP